MASTKTNTGDHKRTHQRSNQSGCSERVRESLPESSPSSQPKKKPRAKATKVLYSVRGILAERESEEGLKYLIDWDDQKVTGEKYNPSWEPAHFVTKDVIEDWEVQKFSRADQVEQQNDIEAVSLRDSIESEPVRTAKRKRSKIHAEDSLSGNTSSPQYYISKRAKRKQTSPLASQPVSRKELVIPQRYTDAVEQSFDARELLPDSSPVGARVEITLQDSFDRDAYAQIPADSLIFSAQSTVASSAVQQRLYSATQSHLASQTTLHGVGGVIPDSQEGLGSSSYSSVELVAKGTTIGTHPDSAVHGVTHNWTNRASIPRSRPDSSTPTSSTGFSASDSAAGKVAVTSPLPERGTWLEDAEQDTNTFLTQKDQGLSLEHELNNQWPTYSLDSVPNSLNKVQGVETLLSNQPFGAEPTLDSNQDSRVQAFITGSDPTHPSVRMITSIVGQTQVYLQDQSPPATESEDPSTFQTQIPFVRDNITLDRNDRDKRSNLSTTSLENGEEVYQQLLAHSTHKQEVSADVSYTGNPPRHQTSAATKSASGSTETWQDAQVVSDLGLSSQSGAPSFEIYHEATRSVSSRNNSSPDRSIEESALSQRDPNSQKAITRGDVFGIVASAPEGKLAVLTSGPREVVLESVETIDIGAKTSSVFPHTPSPPSSDLPSPSRLDDSALPPQPNTSSLFNMADGEDRGVSPALSATEMLKLVRARSAAAARSTRSPSVIPPKRPSSPPPATNQMLPVRESNATSSAGPSPSIETSDVVPLPVTEEEFYQSSNDNILPSLDLGPMEFTILLPMISMVREVYQATVYNRRREIELFLNGEDLQDDTVLQMNEMIEDLKLIADHQDLASDLSSTQATVSDDVQAKWAVTCSTKCQFLKELFEATRSFEIHIAVLVRPGRMLDILEALLRANNYAYDRPDRPSPQQPNAKGPLQITLLATGLEGGQFVVHRADAVIAFDSTFYSSERYSNILRAHVYEPKRLSPLISLMVANSAEHLERSLPKLLDPGERTANLVSFITQTRHEVGVLDPDFPLPDEAAAAVGQFLTIDNSSWPLPPNRFVSGLEISINFQTQRPQYSGSTTQSQDHQIRAPIPQGPIKRSFDNQFDEDASKRMRMTPALEESRSTSDITRVSESVGYPSQARPTPMPEAPQEAFVTGVALGDEVTTQIASLLAKVADLEARIQEKDRKESRLQLFINSLETRLADHVNAIKKIQPKYQQALDDRAKLQSQCDIAQAQVITMTQRVEARAAELVKLKGEKATIEVELNTARASLTGSVVPEVAEIAKANDHTRSLQADKERLEKRITSMQRDFEFTRDEYQKASSSAAELASELLELKEEMITLQRKASENILHIAELQRANGTKEREERISELEAQLRERDQELWKKNEELKVKTNGRRETRGTSVPRSPRMGSGAMSPRPYVARGNSRGNSPAPGEQVMREGVRDPILFLPSGSRWNHLREGM